MGTEDYIRPIYPEDDMEILGEYLMVRFYPDYTQLRLEMGLPYPIPEEVKPAFSTELQNRIAPEYQEKDLDKEKRGRSITLGLWMFETHAREPLKYVMMRYVSVQYWCIRSAPNHASWGSSSERRCARWSAETLVVFNQSAFQPRKNHVALDL